MNTFVLYISALFLLILIFVNTYQLYLLIKTSKHTISQVQQYADEGFDKRELTSYELERLEREEEFDKRIERLKDELAEQQAVLRRGTIADELHPLVHNLPHDAVQTKYDVLPDVEVAD